jgi:outer membrane lipoprotein-sorting protein
MKLNHFNMLPTVLAWCCGSVVLVANAADPAVHRPSTAAPSTRTGATRKEPAAPPAPNLPRLSIDQLVEKNVAARGGASAWEAVKSISFTGSLDAGKIHPDNGLHPSANERLVDKPGKATKLAQTPDHPASADSGTPITLPYTITMKRPNKQRVEIKFKDQTLVQVYDGDKGWKLQPYLNRRGALPFNADELKKAKQFQQIDGPLIDYAAKGTKIFADGTEVVDGHPTYRLKLVLKSGDTRHLWLDATNFLDVQIDGSRRLNGREVPIYTTLRDFRTVAGVKVPYEMETRTRGQQEREKIVVDKVIMNPAVDDRKFTKPT